MKIIIFNILFILLLLFTQSKGQDPVLAFDLIKDTYEYNGYCLIGHNIAVKSIYNFNVISIEQNDSNVTQSVKLISKELLSGYYYYYYQIESKVAKTEPSFIVYGYLPATKTELKTQYYVCESPPVSLQFQPIYIPAPIKIESTFYLKNDNLKKSFQNVIPTPTESNLPFSLVFIESDKNILSFKLVFNPIYTYKQTASFTCSYGSNNFVLTITLPILGSDITSFLIDSGTILYPNTMDYTTLNNWDLSRLIDLKYLNYHNNFFYTIINSNQLDKNQYYRIVSGNQAIGKMLISFTYYPIDRYQTSSTASMDSKIYSSFPQQMYSTQSTSPTINSLFTVYPFEQSVAFNKYFGEYPIIANYPFDYNFIVKFGNMNSYKPIYPYGITLKIYNSLSTQYQFPLLLNINSTTSFTFITDIGQKQLGQSQLSTTDKTAPVLKEFTLNYLRGGSGYYALLRIGVKDDSSGFLYLYYGGNYITFTDLVNGDRRDGYYEKRITVNFDTTCYYEDIAGNRAYCQNDLNPTSKYYYQLSPSLLSIPMLLNNYTLEVTIFEFENTNSYDLTSEGKLVTIIFNYANSEKDIPIQFYLLDRVYGDQGINFNNYPNNYYWLDNETNNFKITFLVPSKLCVGSLPYLFIINGKRYTNDYFYSIFGDNSILNIVSTDCYEYPPIINSIQYYGSTQSSSPYYVKAEIGWTVKIDSLVNFKYFEFQIVSDLDPLGYTIVYDFEEKDEKSISKTLDLVFEFDPLTTTTQTFRLYNITLVDERGFKSQFLYDRDIEYLYNNQIDKYPIPVSPLYKNSNPSILTITASSNIFTPETSRPILSSLSCLVNSLDVGAMENSDRVLDFTFITEDDSGISSRHVPVLYLDSFLNFGDVNDQRVECETTVIGYSDGNKKASYSASCQLPYGFGGDNGIAVSLFGIVDTSFNFAGYSTNALKSLVTPTYYIPTTFSRLPIIESWDPLKDYQLSLTIYGRNFAFSQSTLVFLTYTNDDIDNQQALNITTLSNVALVLSLPPSKQSFLIYVQSAGIKSNSVIITYPNNSNDSSSSDSSLDSSSSSSSLSSSLSSSSSSDPVIPIVKCLGSPICGGSNRGSCIKDIGCRCIPPYTGLDCLSETIKIPKPTINETSPNIENEFTPLINSTTNDIKLNTIISIVAIRELDIDGKEINKHIFTEWDYQLLSESSYTYSSKISKSNQNVSNIKVDMEWYENSTSIIFASQNITINPSSLKYYINIDQYPFENRFCTLELVIKSTFKSNENGVCSSKEFSLNDETDYITLQIGKFSFEGKFIKRGIIDGKTRVIDNKLLDTFDYGTTTTESSTTNQQISFIAIKIPNYLNHIQLDPNFSVLIGSNGASSKSNNSICSSSKSLTKSQLAGIIVGGALFITLISIFIFIKFSKSSRFLSLKIFIYKSFKSRK